ncbi:Pancreatic triacylglycerol lipase [Frankliniella fusca]|uniref:Pancreatic triacylglycerol lipase n=1 Tax=Frankliniella fusca TaxID=407009 RepID=A0AAE1HPA6_9NEOP|nr:Pancreatic triacylglycerol lipase [Frankliniella fusca]
MAAMHWSSGVVATGLCLWAAYCLVSVEAANWAEKFGDNINLTLYLKDKNVTFNINDSVSILSHPGFKKALPTVLYMHGYTESNQSRSVGLVANAFLKRGDHNFILVDWNYYVTFPYLKAFFNLFQVSHALAKSITRMVEAGVRPESLWVVAHSLGGQLAGVTAKDLDFKISRITALDPALPGFTFDGIPNLGPKDAEFVDVIHTDGGFFGFNQLIGHIDFFPNNGTRVQPGCPSYVTGLYDGHCSHHRSWDFFAESLLNETAFPAVACPGWTNFTAGECKSTDVAYMGIRAKEARHRPGRYYLVTAEEAPFGKGMLGVANLTTTSSSLLSSVTSLFGGGSNQKPLPTNWGWDQ